MVVDKKTENIFQIPIVIDFLEIRFRKLKMICHCFLFNHDYVFFDVRVNLASEARVNTNHRSDRTLRPVKLFIL